MRYIIFNALRALYTFVLCLVVLLPHGISQGDLPITWAKRVASDVNGGQAEAWTLASDDGLIYWMVNRDQSTPFSFHDSELWVLSARGELVQQFPIAQGPFAQQVYFATVKDSYLYAAGRTCRSIGIDSCDVLLVKFDILSGERIWEFTWDGGYGYEEIDGVVPEDDGILLTGWTKGEASAIDVLLMKVSHQGELVWQSSWSSPGMRDDHQDGHVVVDDTHIYVGGLYGGTPILGFEGQALLARFSKMDGSYLDHIEFGRMDPWLNAENVLGMTSDDNHLYVTGYSTVSPQNWEIFVAKYTEDLERVWYTTWGDSSAAEVARAIAIGPDGKLYIGGNTESLGNGGMDAVLLRLSIESGEVEKYWLWGAALDDQIHDIHIAESRIYLTGRTNSFHANQRFEALLLQVDPTVTSVSTKLSHMRTPVQISPNPCRFRCRVYPKITASDIIVFDGLGHNVYEGKMEGGMFSLPGDFRSGLYYINVVRADRVIGTGKVIVL